MASQPITSKDYPQEETLLGKAGQRRGRAASSWVLKPKHDRNLWERIVALDLCPPEVYFEKPAQFERGPVPVHPMWRENFFICTLGLLPVYIQWLSYKIFPGITWHPMAAFNFYSACFIWFAGTNIKRLHYYMRVYGVLDEHVRGRDLISDIKKDKLGAGILMFILLRTSAPFILAYNRQEMPSFSMWTPIKLGLWLVAVDFFFYIYHRSCHEVSFLWFIHRAHHGTKHPTPILSFLADDYQEVIETLLVPLAASSVMPLNFAESWAAICYLIYVEMLGHSGIRAHWAHPILTVVLEPFGMELAVEDHDLHHRYGRGGKNYGKQTRLFDRILGTVAERETTKGMTSIYK